MSRRNGELEWVNEMETTAQGRALGTDVLVVVTQGAQLCSAKREVERVVNDIDGTCSRFRPDTELSRLNARAGEMTKVSPLMAKAVATALRAAEITGGAVDPTLGARLRFLGYDQDFKLLEESNATPGMSCDGVRRPEIPPAWTRIELQLEESVVFLPVDVELDLGATAKALAADLAAEAAALAGASGVLVSLGGDIAMSGQAPEGGWVVGVDADSSREPGKTGERIALSGGGIASSSTQIRRWTQFGVSMHHILNPQTGAPAAGPFRLATVIGRSCAEANTASTAAIVRGDAIVPWLVRRTLPARLERCDGSVSRIAGWPQWSAA